VQVADCNARLEDALHELAHMEAPAPGTLEQLQ